MTSIQQKRLSRVSLSPFFRPIEGKWETTQGKHSSISLQGVDLNNERYKTSINVALGAQWAARTRRVETALDTKQLWAILNAIRNNHLYGNSDCSTDRFTYVEYSKT